MSNVAIKVENLHKLYRLGMKEEKHESLVSSCLSWLKAPKKNFQNLRKLSRFDLNNPEEDVLHALNDVSFEVQHGEVLGIIGRNGAGKSTLLKVLSRITEPTAGRITINGRVASLLEVGTGFHPELTGRENIYMNGTILGMTKREIDRKFDEIVDFSGVEKFLDTPIKRYSSGMKVRLAFSVAAHLEPEILVIDEVLAVGDVTFQRKCLGKMQQVARDGRTVLFVSHQLDAITNLCNRAVILEKGNLIGDGLPDDIVSIYLMQQAQANVKPISLRRDRRGDGNIRFVNTWVENILGDKSEIIQSGSAFKIVAEYKTSDGFNVKNLDVAFAISNDRDIPISDLSNRTMDMVFEKNIPSYGRVECLVERVPLNVGLYNYSLWVRTLGGVEDHVLNAGSFEIISGDFFKSGRLPDSKWPFLIENHWKLFSLSDTIVSSHEVENCKRTWSR